MKQDSEVSQRTSYLSAANIWIRCTHVFVHLSFANARCLWTSDIYVTFTAHGPEFALVSLRCNPRGTCLTKTLSPSLFLMSVPFFDELRKLVLDKIG